jgi:prolyl 4-hydroxylase
MTQPLTPELRDWIQKQLATGYPLSTLRAPIMEAGWDSDSADAALAEIDSVKQMPGPDLTGSPLYIDAGDRFVSVLLTINHPRIVLFGNLVSDEECDALISVARHRMVRSMTINEKTGGEILHQDRTSEGMFYNRAENLVVERLEARIARIIRWPVERGEGLQILRYSVGAQYKPHYDYFVPTEAGTSVLLRQGGQRLASMVIYLQEPEGGGATTFPDIGLEVSPKRGSAVFFSYERPEPNSKTLHGGAPVIAGEKWVATKWLREGEFKFTAGG